MLTALLATMATIASHLIEPIRTAVLERLRQTAEFVAPPALAIVSTADGDVAGQVDRALRAPSGGGAVILVAQPRPIIRTGEVQTVSIPIDIEEDAVLNRGVGGTKRTAPAIAEAVVARLRKWQPDLACGPLVLASWDRPDGTGQLVHSITFTVGIML